MNVYTKESIIRGAVTRSQTLQRRGIDNTPTR